MVREEPVLSGSLAVRKIGGTWQEECWVRTIKVLGVERIIHMTVVLTFCVTGSTDGLEAESLEQCGTV